MKRGFFDLESDGLLDKATKVHCLTVIIDGNKRRFLQADIPKALKLLDTCDEIVAHNGIGFDLMLLWLLYRWKPKAHVVDTLILSCLVHADIFGGHSLDAWGERVGEKKMDYAAAYVAWRTEADPTYKYSPGDEWVEYNPVMGDYCDQDVVVLVKVHDRIRADMQGWDWRDSEWMEHEFAKLFARQTWRGVAINVPHTEKLVAQLTKEMEEIAAKVEPLLPERPGTKGQIKSCTPPKLCFKKDGTLTAATKAWFEDFREHAMEDGVWEAKYNGEWYTLPTPMAEDGTERAPLRTMFPMKLSDQEHLKAWLMDCGWIPTMWSYKKAPDKHGKLRIVRGDDGQPVPTQPKFHDKGILCPNLEKISSTFEHVNLVVRWMVVRHRLGFAQGVLDNLRADGTVGATGMALGTPTSRVTHSVVANVPKAEKEVVLGKECRMIFEARKGRKFAGVDASGLELRCLAHYVGSPQIIDMIVNGKKEDGTEIHTYLHTACKELVPTRSAQKNVNYGWLYGASDKKMGQTAGHNDTKAEKVGAEIRRRLVKAIPGLEALIGEDGKGGKVGEAAKRGYVKAIDGRRIAIRSKHAALNTLLQSCGSILVKWATVYMNQKIIEQRLDAWQVIHYHDEVQLDCHPLHAEKAGALFIEGLRWAGERFKFRCPLDGECKIGNNWADTH